MEKVSFDDEIREMESFIKPKSPRISVIDSTLSLCVQPLINTNNTLQQVRIRSIVE